MHEFDSPGSNRRYVYFGLSLVLSIGLVGYLLHQIEIKDLIRALKNLYVPTLMVYCFLAILGVLTRALHNYRLLQSTGTRYRDLVLVTLVRNLFVDLIPARIGSLSYVYLINRRLGFPFETAASSFLVAFLFDFIVLFPMFFAAIFWIQSDSFFSLSFPFVVVCILLFIATIAILMFLGPIIRIAVHIGVLLVQKSPFIDNPMVKRIIDKLLLTAQDLERIKRCKNAYGKIILSSFLIRGFKYGSLYFLLHSVLFQFNFRLQDLNFINVFLGILGAELSAVLPIHGVAGFGTWESAWTLTFKMMGYFDPKIAIVSGFGVHLTTQAFEYFLGIIALLILYLPLKYGSKRI